MSLRLPAERLYNLPVPDRPLRAPRPEPREIVELKNLKAAQPELASAVDMQVALLGIQRRVQSRVPLPWIQADPEWLRSQYSVGRAVVRFADIPLDWTDFRLTLRQTADILHRFDTLERADYDQILALSRDGNLLEPMVISWYESTSGANGDDSPSRDSQPSTENLTHVLVLAIRPFLARCVEVLAQQAELPLLTSRRCPYCGWEPDFSVITPAADRRLICGRCVAQWAFDPLACPFCANDDRSLITSFATRDGRYRVYGCDVCRRYLKAYDGRSAERPVLVAVDTIATLPLDAAAIQRGYLG
jgi:Protein involved in formate dehydrogenase formation